MTQRRTSIFGKLRSESVGALNAQAPPTAGDVPEPVGAQVRKAFRPVVRPIKGKTGTHQAAFTGKVSRFDADVDEKNCCNGRLSH